MTSSLTDRLITTDTVLTLVRLLWPVYTGDAVDVQLVERSGKHTVDGTVGWDGSRWVVRLDAKHGTDAEYLLWLLSHELGHIMLGTARRAGDAAGSEAHRAAFEGEAGPIAEHIRRTWAERSRDGGHRATERDVNRWADEFVSIWWPALQDIAYAAVDAAKRVLRGRKWTS